MSKLADKINNDMKQAMKDQDKDRLGALRMLNSAITNKQIEAGRDKGLKDEDIVQVIKSEVKKRRDSFESYKQGGRDDLAEKEAKETGVLEAYLPEQLDDEAVKQAVRQVMAETGAAGPADFGQVMGAVMGKLKGQADGGQVSRIVKEELSK